MDLSRKLTYINKDLLSKGVKLRIEQRGQRLNIRGPLPSRKPSEPKSIQRISLHLEANPQGLEEAQKLTKLVHFQLECDQFDWKNWSDGQKNPYQIKPRMLVNPLKVSRMHSSLIHTVGNTKQGLEQHGLLLICPT